MTQSKQDSSTEQEPGTAQDFLAFLAGINKGRTARELGTQLQELVAAIQDTGKGGTLTLKISVKPAGKSDALTVTDDITVKAPRLARAESIFFSDADHNLVRTNPNQSELF